MDSNAEIEQQYEPILEKLDLASRQLAQVANAQDDLQEQRAEAVVEISRLGAPRSVVAKLTGLTRGRVQQILEGAGATGTTGDRWNDPELRDLIEQAIRNRPLPSIGLGLRRESPGGPHIGKGFGGQVRLSGDIENDRDMVIEVLNRLIEKARAHELDDLLTLTEEEREILDGRLVE